VKIQESGKLNTHSTIKVAEKLVELLSQTNKSFDTRMEGIKHTNL